MSDTLRTGTEQLLLSSAIDQAVNLIDFETLAGKPVFLDTQYLKGVIDEGYVTSTLRQHLVANGCVLKSNIADAKYVIEARAMVGTNRNEVLMGIPSMSLPNFGVPGVPSAIPEIALAKSTAQKGVAKIAVFAYNRETGNAVWQSGAYPVATDAKNTWIFGAGPFQRGSIYDGTRFAGSKLPFGRRDTIPGVEMAPSAVSVTSSRVFVESEEPPKVAAPAPSAPGATPAAIPAGASGSGSQIVPISGANAPTSVPATPPTAPAAPAAAAKPSIPNPPGFSPVLPPPPAPGVAPVGNTGGSIINTGAPAVNVPDSSWTGSATSPGPASAGPWSGLFLVPAIKPEAMKLPSW